jgi:two-component system, LytTR family, response regulator
MLNEKYKAVIVDDEHNAREMISLLLEQMFPTIEVVDKLNSVTAATRVIPVCNPDILFLDIKMADGTGFDLLKRLPQKPTVVIFVTAYDDFAITAIKASAFDYILKPIEEDEFNTAVNKAIGYMEAHNQNKPLPEVNHPVKKIGLPNLTGYRFVDTSTILRCEADGHYTHMFFTNAPKEFISKSLSYFEPELVKHQFFRIHNKHLINLNFIETYAKGKGGGYITMTDGTTLEVAARKKSELLKIMF